MRTLFSILKDLDINYEKHDHIAVFTCEESKGRTDHLDGANDKNLFLRNRKGNKHYLVSVLAEKKVDLKELASKLNESKLSFGSPERLMKYLKLTPGSVSPFGLIHDTEHEVTIIVDEDLIAHEKLQFHPNINTSTLVISSIDFRKFLSWTGNEVKYLKL